MTTRRHRLLPGLFVCAIALACAGPGRALAQAPCPTTSLALSTSDGFVTAAASLDSSYLLNRLQYDLVPGTLHLWFCCSIFPTYMYVRDAYDVAGVAPGTPVPLTVEIPVSGEVFDGGTCGGGGCAGLFRASITHGADYAEFVHSVALYGGARSPFSGVVSLPITIVAGQPETIRFEFYARRAAGGSHGAEGQGAIRFVGLPFGASVTSCQGFAGEVVPVRRTTWGAVKTLYR